jgi:hypothetical protein
MISSRRRIGQWRDHATDGARHTILAVTADGALPLCLVRQWQIVVRYLTTRKRDNDIRYAKLDLLVAVGDLRQETSRSTRTLRERIAFRDRQAEEEGMEHHAAQFT